MGKRRVLLAGVAVVVGATGVGGIAVANGGHDRFRAELRGTNEVDSPGGVQDQDARGKAEIRIKDTAAGSEICYSVRFERTGTPLRGHIHVGAAGANGGIVVPLFELAGMTADARNDALEKGRLEACLLPDPALEAAVAAIKANPSGYYVNIHNARFPGGSARGQLRN